MSYAIRVTDPRSGEEVWISKGAALASAHSAARLCEHLETEVRLWTNANGSKGAWAQCLSCGLRRGNAIGLTTRDHPAQADVGLAERWRQRVTANIDKINIRFIDRQLASDEEFWAPYNEYLASDAWRRKADLVLKRCAGVCEGCGSAPATQVHHMSYEHVYSEFLFELRGMCVPCHERWHEGNPGGPLTETGEDFE